MKDYRNIELFDQVVAVTLLELYKHFPSPIDLETAKIASLVTDVQDVELYDLHADLPLNSVSFLAAEGFITFDARERTLAGPEFPRARLTLKGFTLLGQVPHSISPGSCQPYVDLFREAVAEGAKGTVSDMVKSMFMTALMTGATAFN